MKTTGGVVADDPDVGFVAVPLDFVVGVGTDDRVVDFAFGCLVDGVVRAVAGDWSLGLVVSVLTLRGFPPPPPEHALRSTATAIAPQAVTTLRLTKRAIGGAYACTAAAARRSSRAPVGYP
jgi:hypothetical protein